MALCLKLLKILKKMDEKEGTCYAFHVIFPSVLSMFFLQKTRVSQCISPQRILDYSEIIRDRTRLNEAGTKEGEKE